MAALLLKEAGYEVVGAMMRFWPDLPPPSLEAGKPRAWESCCTPDAAYEARRVADRLGIPFYLLDYREVFEEEIISPSSRTTPRGAPRTPAPGATPSSSSGPSSSRREGSAWTTWPRATTCGRRALPSLGALTPTRTRPTSSGAPPRRPFPTSSSPWGGSPSPRCGPSPRRRASPRRGGPKARTSASWPATSKASSRSA